ncbi:hypothetical protein Hanom_Chr11g00983381 [Helianthus anomalus]
MSFYTVIQMCNKTSLYWFSTYWFRASYPFRPLIHSALIDSDIAKQPLNEVTCLAHEDIFVISLCKDYFVIYIPGAFCTKNK